MSLIFADPTKDPRLVKHILDKFETEQIKLYNFGSILNIGTRLDKLYPEPNVMAILKEADFGNGDYELSLRFDRYYMQQLLSNEESFKQLMLFMTETQDDNDLYIIRTLLFFKLIGKLLGLLIIFVFMSLLKLISLLPSFF